MRPGLNHPLVLNWLLFCMSCSANIITHASMTPLCSFLCLVHTPSGHTLWLVTCPHCSFLCHVHTLIGCLLSASKLFSTSCSFLCPVHTPDGAPCGLLSHLTAACAVVASPPENPEDAQHAVMQVIHICLNVVNLPCAC